MKISWLGGLKTGNAVWFTSALWVWIALSPGTHSSLPVDLAPGSRAASPPNQREPTPSELPGAFAFTGSTYPRLSCTVDNGASFLPNFYQTEHLPCGCVGCWRYNDEQVVSLSLFPTVNQILFRCLQAAFHNDSDTEYVHQCLVSE